MIDTLKVELNGFEVRPDHGLTIQPAAIIPRTGEMVGSFRLWNGVEARAAYHNTPKYQFDIQHRFGKVRATVKLSLPGYAGSDNVSAIPKGEAVAVMKDLQHELDEIGVACNLEDGRLSRMDAFRNVNASEPFRTYSPVLQLLDGKRMRDKVEFGGTSFRWGNNASQINAYDKVEELQSKRRDVTRYSGTNLIRFEHRALDHRKIYGLYGMQTVMDFLHEYDTIPNAYKAVMEKDLFRYDGNGIEVLSEKQIAEEMAREGGHMEVNIDLLDRVESMADARERELPPLTWSDGALALLQMKIKDSPPIALEFVSDMIRHDTEEVAREKGFTTIDEANLSLIHI